MLRKVLRAQKGAKFILSRFQDIAWARVVVTPVFEYRCTLRFIIGLVGKGGLKTVIVTPWI